MVLMRTKAVRTESGAVAILVAVLSMALFAMAALVVDLGHARAVRAEMQSVADSSALAAANRLYLTGLTADTAAAVTAAQDYAASNYNIPAAAWTGCTDSQALAVPAPGTNCISFDSATAPTEVRVNVPPRTVATPIA